MPPGRAVAALNSAVPASCRLLERDRHAVLGKCHVSGRAIAAPEAPAELDACQRRGASAQEEIADQVVAIVVQLDEPSRHLQVKRLGVLGVHLPRDIVQYPFGPARLSQSSCPRSCGRSLWRSHVPRYMTMMASSGAKTCGP